MPEQKWIPASEKPKENGAYLADTERGQRIGTYFSSLNIWFDGDECISKQVLAWMPLPAPYVPPKPVIPEWHDGAETPTCNGEYVVRMKGKIIEAITVTADYRGGWGLSGCWNVIAWMPLPQIPTEILMKH